MPFITSISGIRGTIGGKPGENFTPVDIVHFVSALGTWYSHQGGGAVLVGRDARISGDMVTDLVVGTLLALGLDVVDLGLSTTPTVQVLIPEVGAAGGIMISASHNPMEWNALKPLNKEGEFLNQAAVDEVLQLARQNAFTYASVEDLGKKTQRTDAVEIHINKILDLPAVDTAAIIQANFKVAVDGVNSSGGVFIPQLLHALGITQIETIHCEPTGRFAHNPEPLDQHLTDIKQFVRDTQSDLGIVVDPDADRLVLIDETGTMVNEEYTIVLAADYIMQHQPGVVVSNLSSSRALADVAQRRGSRYLTSPVGEINVVQVMKEHHAIIGGEGSGGVIYPPLHYGRDALVGVALILSHLAKTGTSLSKLRATYPDYVIVKTKVPLTPAVDMANMTAALKQAFAGERITDIDGIKIDFQDGWVQLRQSNTEPILRIYAEAETEALAHQLVERVRAVAHL